MIERKDPVDFKEAIEALLRFDADEDLTELHPISGLVQTLVEVTDPINYAPNWYHSEGAGWAQHPTSVLLTSGQADAQTPHRTAEHMAAAARMPIVSPAVNQPTSQDLRGLVSIEKPRNNAEAYDGTFVTSGLSQWPATPDGDHFVLFNNTDAARMYQYFLTSASQGEAVIDPVH